MDNKENKVLLTEEVYQQLIEATSKNILKLKREQTGVIENIESDQLILKELKKEIRLLKKDIRLKRKNKRNTLINILCGKFDLIRINRELEISNNRISEVNCKFISEEEKFINQLNYE